MSATGSCSSACSQRGFTLVEVMVVLVLISIITLMIPFTVGQDPWRDALEEEAERVTALMRLASEEAILGGRELALRFDVDGYRFYQLGSDGWVPLAEQDALFRDRTVEPGLELRLDLGGGLELPGTEDDEEGPQVFVLSSGEVTPFQLQLSTPRTDHRYLVEAQLNGEVHWESLPL